MSINNLMLTLEECESKDELIQIINSYIESGILKRFIVDGENFNEEVPGVCLIEDSTGHISVDDFDCLVLFPNSVYRLEGVEGFAIIRNIADIMFAEYKQNASQE